jgi:predicted dehydrogenase
VGLGRIARSHAAGYKALGESALIAGVCDVDRERAEAFSSEFGGRVYPSLAALLDDPSIDAIDLILPHNEHVMAAQAVLATDRHLMIEKPLAPSYAQSLEICRAASQHKGVFLVAENTRYVRAYQVVHDLLAQNAIGAVNQVRTFLSSNMKPRLAKGDFWGRTYAGGGGLVLDSAPHSFYLIAWLLGPIDRLAMSMDAVFPIDEGVEIEDVAEIVGVMASGAHLSCGFSSVAELPHAERLELYGASGAIIVDQLADPVVKLYSGSREFQGVEVQGVSYGPDGWNPGGWHFESIKLEVRDFVESIIERRKPLVDAFEAAYSIAAIDAAYASVRSNHGSAVTVAPFVRAAPSA